VPELASVGDEEARNELAKKKQPNQTGPQGSVDERKPGPGRPQGHRTPRPQILNIRGCVEWKAWLERFAEHCRTDMVGTIDQALESYAYSKGFERPPRR
jgi:hypothetical protein